jgi:hypothetical protein
VNKSDRSLNESGRSLNKSGRSLNLTKSRNATHNLKKDTNTTVQYKDCYYTERTENGDVHSGRLVPDTQESKSA